MIALRIVVLLLLWPAILSAQQLWKVNCQGGPGINFTDLPAAVAAASAGDTIWVFGTNAGCPGVGGGATYTATVIDKPLNILGFTVYSPPLPPGSIPTRTPLLGVLEISGIPAGQRVLVSNVVTGAPFIFGAPPPFGIRVANCAGEVILDGCQFTNIGVVNQVAEIVNCTNVTLHWCGFVFGGAPLSIINSNVFMTSTDMGSSPPFPLGGEYQQTSPAISLVDSTLTVAGCLIRGSDWYAPGLIARPGVWLSNSTVYVGPGTTLTGGRVQYFPGWPVSYLYSFFPITPTPSPVYQDPRSLIVPGWATIAPRDIDATYLNYAVANQTFRTWVAGPIDGFALLMLGDWSPAPIATPYGDLLVDPQTAMFVELLPLPAAMSGAAIRDYFVPSSALNAHAYALQSLTLSPAGVLGLTLPTPFAVGWEHGRLP